MERATIVMVFLLITASAIYSLSYSLLLAGNESVLVKASTFHTGSFIDQNKKPYELKQLKGHVAVINFWATWCGPCREEMPELSMLSKAYKNKGVIFLGIAANDLEGVREYVQKTNVDYTNLAADFEAIRLSKSVGNGAGVLPYTVIIDREGNILYRHAGRIALENIQFILNKELKKKI